MKKVFAILVAAIAIIACGTTTNTTVNYVNVPVTWDNISTSDSAFESFKMSNAGDQLDVLRSLLSEAENRIYDVKDQDQLQVFKSKVLNIKRYYSVAKKQSLAIENRIRDLEVRISKVEE